MTTKDYEPARASAIDDSLCRILDESVSSEDTLVREPDAKRLLELLGIPVPRGALAVTESEAFAIATNLDVPVILKVVSPDVAHKSAVGGVLRIAGPDQVGEAYQEIMSSVTDHAPDARVQGVLVEEIVEEGIECVVAYTSATALGPAVMFGPGGVSLDATSDVGFRLAPLEAHDALQLVEESRSPSVSSVSARGFEVGKAKLVQALVSIGDIARFSRASHRIRELEVNPILVRRDGIVALDALGALHGSEGKDRDLE